MTRQRKRKSRFSPYDYGADADLGFNPEVPFTTAELAELRRMADQIKVGRKRAPDSAALKAIEDAFVDMASRHNVVRHRLPDGEWFNLEPRDAARQHRGLRPLFTMGNESDLQKSGD